MIRRLKMFRGESTDPHYNLAVEQHLMETVGEDECVLYLWQNRNTVVIGANQNAWKECRVSLLEGEGGRLARRLSGGGAVFHDLGNLNFTFLVSEENYDLDRQMTVIERACRLLGIDARRSGRNDVLADGRKFSGNAFYHSGGKAYHHGTLLVSVDGEKLARYLSPSKAKLEAKGVDSVRARVVNLIELSPGLTCERMAECMTAAFGAVYGLPVESMDASALDAQTVEKYRARNASDEWLYGKPLPLSFECEERFDWGGVQLQLQAQAGVVTGVKVYSDAMDASLAPTVERALAGSRFDPKELCDRLAGAPLDPRIGDDLRAMIEKQQI